MQNLHLLDAGYFPCHELVKVCNNVIVKLEENAKRFACPGISAFNLIVS